MAGKQSGTTYYQNYLRNRREKGGELLGPPLPLPLQLGGEQPPIAQQPTRDVPEQQHQQQQQIEAAQGVISPPSSDAAVIDATRLQQLLEQCLAAATPTTPPPVSLQQQPPLTPAQQQRLLSKQRQPWQLPDYVSPELADGMVQLLKRRRGVKVEPPELTTGVCVETRSLKAPSAGAFMICRRGSGDKQRHEMHPTTTPLHD